MMTVDLTKKVLLFAIWIDFFVLVRNLLLLQGDPCALRKWTKLHVTKVSNIYAADAISKRTHPA